MPADRLRRLFRQNEPRGEYRAGQRAFRVAFFLAGLATLAALAAAAWPIVMELHAERAAATDPRPAYVDRVLRKIQEATETALAQFPPGDRSGRVVLRIGIDPHGTLVSTAVDQPSGFADLDALALRIVARASPFEPFPADVRRNTTLIEIASEFVFPWNSSQKPLQPRKQTEAH